jgi:hypothetical protein
VIERFDVSSQGQPVYHWDELARKMAAHVGSEKSFEDNFLRSAGSPVSPGLMLEAGGIAYPLQVDNDSDPDGTRLLMRDSFGSGFRIGQRSDYGRPLISQH